MIDDLCLRNIFGYLYDPRDRGAVSRVCRRWRRNSMFVAPRSSLKFWVTEKNERLANLLLDLARDQMGLRLPQDLVRIAIENNMVSTVKRFASHEIFPSVLEQTQHFTTVFSRYRRSRFLRNQSDEMFDVLFQHPIYNWQHLLKHAVEVHMVNAVACILSDARSPFTGVTEWFTDLFEKSAIYRGNIDIARLYICDTLGRYDTSRTNDLFLDVCSKGYPEIVRLLLQHRPELDINYIDGSPLHGAVFDGHKTIVEILLADPRLRVSEIQAARLLNASSHAVRHPIRTMLQAYLNRFATLRTASQPANQT